MRGFLPDSVFDMKNLFAKLGIHNRADFWAFVKQFIRFVIVGLSNTAVSFVVHYALLFAGVHYVIAGTVAFIISVINAFFWSRKFVFKDCEDHVLVQLGRTYAAYGFSFALSLGLSILMVEVLKISPFIVPLILLFITVPLNFLVNKFWTFRKKKL